MFTRIVAQSLHRRRRRKVLSLAAVTLGVAVVTTVSTISLDVGDRVNRELRAAGANIVVEPAADGLPVSVGGIDFRPAGAGAYLDESKLVNLKKIFWRNSILAFAPFVYAPATVEGRRVVLIGAWFDHSLDGDASQVFVTGLSRLDRAWKMEGAWPAEGDRHHCVLGRRLAESLGARIGGELEMSVAPPPLHSPSVSDVLLSEHDSATAPLPVALQVSGIVETGGPEDDQVLASLGLVQELTGLEGKIRRVEVSALTKPDDALARMKVEDMTPEQYERWSCSNYASTVAYQIEQAIPGAIARPVFQTAETEGKILRAVSSLMTLLAGAALLAAVLAIGSVMLAGVLERRTEIGLFKSLGATGGQVAGIFLAEAFCVGLAGGLAGYLAGSALAVRLAWTVLGGPIRLHWVFLPVALLLALIVTLAGSALPLERSLRVSAATALR